MLCHDMCVSVLYHILKLLGHCHIGCVYIASYHAALSAMYSLVPLPILHTYYKLISDLKFSNVVYLKSSCTHIAIQQYCN